MDKDRLIESALESSLRSHGSELSSLLSMTIAESDENLKASLSRLRASINKSSVDTAADRHRTSSISSVESETPETRKSNQRLREFIVRKFPSLFHRESETTNKSTNLESIKNDQQASESAFGACPPLESFFDISSKKLKEKFFSDIRIGDCLCGEIRSVEESGVTIRLLCTDSSRMHRILEDLRLDVFLPKSELLVPKPGDDPFAIYCKKKFVRAAVSSVLPERHHLSIVIKTASSVGGTAIIPRRLGIVSEGELPEYFRTNREESDDDNNSDDGKHRKFEATMRASSGFLNPASVDNLCRHFGLEPRAQYSLSRSSDQTTPSCETAKELRKMQSYRLAMRSVVKGVERLRNKQNAEAMQHFNRALDVDPDNVEGLVGRGALYANCESYDFAKKDFERALVVDPNHVNARLYLAETMERQERQKRRSKSERGSESKKRKHSAAGDEDDDVVIIEEKAKNSSSSVDRPRRREERKHQDPVVKKKHSDDDRRDRHSSSKQGKSDRNGKRSPRRSPSKQEKRHSMDKKRTEPGQRDRQHSQSSQGNRDELSVVYSRSRQEKPPITTISKGNDSASTSTNGKPASPKGKPKEVDVKLTKQLSDMEKFIAGLKSKQRAPEKL